MRKRVSLQSLLLWRLGWGLTLLWLLMVGLAASLVYQQFNQMYDSALQETGERLLPLAIQEIFNRDQQVNGQSLPALNEHDEYLTYRVINPDGETLLASHTAQVDRFPVQPRLGFSQQAGYRIYTAAAVSDHYFIQIAEPLSQRREFLVRFLLVLLAPLGLLLPLSLGSSFLAVRQALKPVKNFLGQVESLSPGQLTPLQTQELPAEIQPLGQGFNHLLARLDRALQAERRFTGNAAHELRTPLATALAQLQLLQQQLQQPDQQEASRKVETSLKRLSQLTDKLFQLALAEGGGLLVEDAYDLLPWLRWLVNELPEQDQQRLDWQYPEQPVMTLMDPDALALVVGNLLENAFKYSPADQRIQLQLDQQGWLKVINAGPPVDQAELERLHQPFVRCRVEVQGAGLGLALVSALLEGLGEKLILRSPASGRYEGFEASCKLKVDKYAGSSD
ncbi:sensor histidine kinase [Marinospirillum perlucidum]|uniref:sensor histidine kinase n=1 Tax=Marinospirillum perlucidum TaxID=1982602 RepID=UPI000DF13863|nr:ATP-binding protein [Marinospirillum perlucidum]